MYSFCFLISNGRILVPICLKDVCVHGFQEEVLERKTVRFLAAKKCECFMQQKKKKMSLPEVITAFHSWVQSGRFAVCVYCRAVTGAGGMRNGSKGRVWHAERSLLTHYLPCAILAHKWSSTLSPACCNSRWINQSALIVNGQISDTFKNLQTSHIPRISNAQATRFETALLSQL